LIQLERIRLQRSSTGWTRPAFPRSRARSDGGARAEGRGIRRGAAQPRGTASGEAWSDKSVVANARRSSVINAAPEHRRMSHHMLLLLIASRDLDDQRDASCSRRLGNGYQQSFEGATVEKYADPNAALALRDRSTATEEGGYAIANPKPAAAEATVQPKSPTAQPTAKLKPSAAKPAAKPVATSPPPSRWASCPLVTTMRASGLLRYRQPILAVPSARLRPRRTRSAKETRARQWRLRER